MEEGPPFSRPGGGSWFGLGNEQCANATYEQRIDDPGRLPLHRDCSRLPRSACLSIPFVLLCVLCHKVPCRSDTPPGPPHTAWHTSSHACWPVPNAHVACSSVSLHTFGRMLPLHTSHAPCTALLPTLQPAACTIQHFPVHGHTQQPAQYRMRLQAQHDTILTVLISFRHAAAYNWCIVPYSGADAVLFAGVCTRVHHAFIHS